MVSNVSLHMLYKPSLYCTAEGQHGIMGFMLISRAFLPLFGNNAANQRVGYVYDVFPAANY